MRFVRSFGVLCAATALVFTAAAPAKAARPPQVLIEGLSSPKGLDIFEGDPVVSQGAFGPPGPVIVYPLTGPGAGTPMPITDPENLMDVAVSDFDGTGWGIGGDLVLYKEATPGGEIVPVLDIAAYQAGDPDPRDQENNPTESNPYGLAILPDGDALVADAAGNDVIRVAPDGSAFTVARFDVQRTETDHVPFPLPPKIAAEAVPTAVTIGPDGWIYVSELKGFPFRPGSSNIWRIPPDAMNARCSAQGVSTGGCELYATGFTAVQDIAFNLETGSLYVLELAADGVLAFEAGFETGEFPPAVLLEYKDGALREIAAGEFTEPGGVAVHPTSGHVYVTDGIMNEFTGRLSRVIRR